MYAFLDTETTGFARGGVQPRVVAIAWMIADSVKAVRVSNYCVVRPAGFSIPAHAASVHGITTDIAIRDGKPIGSILRDFGNDLNTLRPVAIVAHNARYDLPIIEAEFEMLGLRNPCAPFRSLCTLLQARSRWPGEGATLGEVYRRIFGQNMKGAHNASADVWACCQIFFHLKG
jgi:DNA polymerase III epsilon subunit-like protein